MRRTIEVYATLCVLNGSDIRAVVSTNLDEPLRFGIGWIGVVIECILRTSEGKIRLFDRVIEGISGSLLP